MTLVTLASLAASSVGISSPTSEEVSMEWIRSIRVGDLVDFCNETLQVNVYRHIFFEFSVLFHFSQMYSVILNSGDSER
jgi:hypothetical protein